MNQDKNRFRIPKEVREDLLEKHGYTCQSCGATGVPLEISHIISLAEGGSNDFNNLTVLCPNCHRAIDSFRPREMEFNLFLYDLLQSSPSYSDASLEPIISTKESARPRYQPDILATRDLTQGKQAVLIEAKNRSFFRRNQLQNAIEQINRYRDIISPDISALAFPGRILGDDRALLEAAKIEVWDLDYIAAQFSEEIAKSSHSNYKRLFSLVSDSRIIHPADILLEKLVSCKPGKRDWSIYQKLVRDIFEYLFTPPLDSPIWESSDFSKINRRDLIFPNHTSEGFWKFLRDSYKADYIVVDPKNYKNKVKKAQVLQIANYLKPHGAGMFAIIASRSGGDKGAITTLREQWAAYRKLIIILTDDDIEAMLMASKSHDNPEKVIGQVIQEFRLSM